jgi:hypothetical protein
MHGSGCKLSAFVFYLFMVHLTMLSVTQTTQCGENYENNAKVDNLPKTPE